MTSISAIRAGGNGAAGQAMAVLVFEGERWHRFDSNLYACVMEWPLRAVRPSLGRLRGLLRTFSSLQASKVSTRELRLLNYLWRYLSARRARKIGGAIWASCVAVISGSSVQSLL